MTDPTVIAPGGSTKGVTFEPVPKGPIATGMARASPVEWCTTVLPSAVPTDPRNAVDLRPFARSEIER